MAVVATTGSASIEAADDETSGAPRPTTVAVKRISRDRRPTRTSSARDLEDVAGPDRRAELHVGVRREQALVAVGADAHLGGDVAEEPEA